MKVKELIEILQAMNDDMPVFLEDNNGLRKEVNGIIGYDCDTAYKVIISVFNNNQIMKGGENKMLQNQQVIFTDSNKNEFEGYVLNVKTDQFAENIGLQCTEIAEIIYKNDKDNYTIVKVPVSKVRAIIHH